MGNYDFSNTYLSKKNITLLKKANHKKQLKYDNKYDELLKSNFIYYCKYESDEIGNQIPIKDMIEISEKGKAFLAFMKKDQFRFYFPIVISLISLAVSIIAFFMS
ncbi:MAG: hypothetical protein IKO47_08635 [Ruminococcus sp.]|nr:hypothetical protein [Ruminococcus sp.]